jgi:hypothetical protein
MIALRPPAFVALQPFKFFGINWNVCFEQIFDDFDFVNNRLSLFFQAAINELLTPVLPGTGSIVGLTRACTNS